MSDQVKQEVEEYAQQVCNQYVYCQYADSLSASDDKQFISDGCEVGGYF